MMHTNSLHMNPSWVHRDSRVHMDYMQIIHFTYDAHMLRMDYIYIYIYIYHANYTQITHVTLFSSYLQSFHQINRWSQVVLHLRVQVWIIHHYQPPAQSFFESHDTPRKVPWLPAHRMWHDSGSPRAIDNTGNLSEIEAMEITLRTWLAFSQVKEGCFTFIQPSWKTKM